MSKGIDSYLYELRGRLAGADPATVQDAVNDAEEHLTNALAQALAADPSSTEERALPAILEQYGSPEEIAKAYREIETRSVPSFAPMPPSEETNPLRRFVAVLGDPRAYASLFFMLFSLITGIVYFTWAVTGVSLSLGLIVLIVGLPFFGLFVFSIQGLALVEGRLIEALLGVRMPRRAGAAPRGKGLWGRFVARVTDPRTWTTLFYLILKLPLGVLSFTVFITLLAYALELMLIPLLQPFFNFPFIVIDDVRFFVPLWTAPILILAGFFDLIVILHLARFTGRLYGGIAKAMLVRG